MATLTCSALSENATQLCNFSQQWQARKKAECFKNYERRTKLDATPMPRLWKDWPAAQLLAAFVAFLRKIEIQPPTDRPTTTDPDPTFAGVLKGVSGVGGFGVERGVESSWGKDRLSPLVGAHISGWYSSCRRVILPHSILPLRAGITIQPPKSIWMY